MLKSVFFIQDDRESGTIWSNLLTQKRLEVASIDLKDAVLEKLVSQPFDLAVVSTQRSRREGINLCGKIRNDLINPLLLIAPWHDEEYVLQAYQAGVDECIPTSIDPRIFLAKVNVWLRRAWTVSAAALRPLVTQAIRLDPEHRQVTIRNGAIRKLTNLEFRVLHLLMTHPERALVLQRDFVLLRDFAFSRRPSD